jgi:hypothetical protein
LSAFAQDDPNCPPGAWFCEETEVTPPPDLDRSAPPARESRAPIDAPPGSTTVVIPPQTNGRRPPVVVYQQVPDAPPAQVVIVAPPAEPAMERPAKPVREVPPPPPPSSERKHLSRTRWGLNLRLEGIALGRDHGAAEDAGMGGIGASLRFRPVPAFALDAGLDLVGGIDYNGFRRTEVPFTVSGLLYVNPRSAVQFYFIGGFNWAHAEVESDTYSPLLDDGDGYSTEYDYFGGHGGIGLEFRVTRHVALNIDGLGFVRSRTDAGFQPEFYDPDTGRSSNTSGGGVFRGGITFWW